MLFFFFLMIRRPPRSKLSSSSAASNVYKGQTLKTPSHLFGFFSVFNQTPLKTLPLIKAVSYTHLPAHETVLELVCRPLPEKKKTKQKKKHKQKHPNTLSKTSSIYYLQNLIKSIQNYLHHNTVLDNQH